MPYLKGMSTNRSFDEINNWWLSNLKNTIEARLKDNPDLTVLDLGCGRKAKAITMLTQIYPTIKGIGLNYKINSNVETSNRLQIVVGDLFNMPFKEVADITYCAFVLHDIFTGIGDLRKETAEAVLKIATTLKKGGVAFVDERIFSARKYSLDYLVDKIQEKNANFIRNYNIKANQSGIYDNYLTIEKK